MQTAGAGGPDGLPGDVDAVFAGGKQLRNRVSCSLDFHPVPRGLARHRRLVDLTASRARGGAAIIVTEPLGMSRGSTCPHACAYWNDDDLDRFALGRGGRIAGLPPARADRRPRPRPQHPGARHRCRRRVGAARRPELERAARTRTSTRSPACSSRWRAPRRGYSRAGFPAASRLHGHGHLFNQFLSPRSNRRRDRYGGDLTSGPCTHRRRTGRCHPRHLRQRLHHRPQVAGQRRGPGSVGPPEAAAITDRLTAFGNVDYVCFGHGSHANSLNSTSPTAMRHVAVGDVLFERIGVAGRSRRNRRCRMR